MTTDATIQSMPRPRGALSHETLHQLIEAHLNFLSAQADYRELVVAALREGSFSAVSKVTGLSTNTLQRWKKEASS